MNEYIDAMINEPSNYVGDGGVTKFMHGDPSHLGEYCCDFDTHIPQKETCELIECCGINGVTHKFMSLEEHSVCSVCHKIVCSYCMAKLNYKKEEKCHNSKLCIECYSLSINDAKETNEASASPKRMILKDRHNVNDVNDLSTAEVLELY